MESKKVPFLLLYLSDNVRLNGNVSVQPRKRFKSRIAAGENAVNVLWDVLMTLAGQHPLVIPDLNVSMIIVKCIRRKHALGLMMSNVPAAVKMVNVYSIMHQQRKMLRHQQRRKIHPHFLLTTEIG